MNKTIFFKMPCRKPVPVIKVRLQTSNTSHTPQ